MQNKCNCGCDQGFVPVSGNWDFNNNGNCDCNSSYSNRSTRRRSNNGCQQCGEHDYGYTRDNDRQSGSDCQCERCDDCREVECCDQNTYIRDMDDCDYNNGAYSRSRSGNKDCDECSGNSTYSRSNDCDKCESGYSRSRSACSGNDDCQCENCTRTRNRSRRSSNGYDKDCDCNGESTYSRNRSGNCGCDKDDSTYSRSRSGNYGCEKDCDYNGNNTYSRSRSGNCGCDNYNGNNASTYARSNKNRTVGMINVERQEIDEIFESESALRAGTIFPELHKPMNGYCPCDENCGTCAQASAFAAWELRLYLNTHPNDKEALKLFRKLCKEAEDVNYATTFLTDDGCNNGWDWVNNPWPWEYDCDCGD